MRRASIRASLLGLVVACLAPALLVSAYLVYENYGLQRERLRRDTLLRARALVSDLDRELSALESGLRMLAISPALVAGDLRSFHARAREALIFQPVDNYVLTDRQGRQHLNTLRDYGAPLPPTGTPPELQRVFDSGETVLSRLFTGALSDKHVVAIGVPVYRGVEIDYALSAGISPPRIAAIVQRHVLLPQWVAAVLDGADSIVARTRAAERFVGEKATSDLREQLRLQNEGVLLSYSKEGVPTYAAFSHSSISDWSVVVAAPRDAIEAPLYRSIAWLLLGATAAVAIGLTIASRLSARVSDSIRALVAPARSLGSGRPVDLAPATALAETEAVGQAIVEASLALRHVRHQAEHDALTGLPNRRLFDELAASRLAEARRHDSCLTLLAIDLDGFKAVNDLHGHAVGDAVLKAAADRICGMLRASDVVARLGGDEFAVLLGETTADDARRVADKLIDVLSAPYAGVVPAVAASVGIASYPAAGQTVQALCEAADRALYRAKRAGRRLSVIDTGA